MSVGLGTSLKLLPVKGVRLASVAAGVRYTGRPDVVVIELADQVRAAGVFTQNRFCAAPVIVSKDHLAANSIRACLVNAGNANAGTGEQGIVDARACCMALAQRLDCEAGNVLPFSTGVIGERLPVKRITESLDECIGKLKEDAWDEAATGIMTTDTVPKGISRQCVIQGKTITITGIVKGSGMIRPNMATMLSYIATDARVSQPVLQELLNEMVCCSFNHTTVDGDTSTNDSCLLFATGASGIDEIKDIKEHGYVILRQAMLDVFLWLAQATIRDAEGVTKFVTINVQDSTSTAEALEVAFTVAHSPLVKTALFASDPNWGRILAAVGRAPVSDLDVGKVSIILGDVYVLRDGALAADYQEQQGQAVMDEDEITITITLGRGTEQATVWTSDLSYDYIKINAEYRS